MKTAAPANVAAYIAGFPRPVQSVLKRVRYKLHGRPVVYFAAFKEHYSLYPSNSRLAARFKNALAGYERSKGTIRFPLSEPVPVKLIEGIATFRAKEVAGREKTKAPGRKTP